MKKRLLDSCKILIPLGLLQACAGGVEIPQPDHAGAAITLNVSIEQTRVVTDASLDAKFEMRDQIGVFAAVRTGAAQAYPASDAAENLMHNVKYVRQPDGSWESDPYTRFNIPQGATVDFYAYYPWVEGADPAAISYNAAVSSADLMTARAVGVTESGSGNVTLVFGHKLALVQIEVDGQDVLSTMDVQMRGVVHRGVLDLTATDPAAEFTADTEATTIIVPNQAGFFCGYLPAQTIAAGVDLLNLNDGGDDMVYTTQAEAKLVAGGIKRYRIAPGAALVDPLTLPNSYLIYPGSRIVIPVAKAFAVWESAALLKDAGQDLGGEPTARLVWQDAEGLVKSVAIAGTGADATITVETDAAKGEGNALVALETGGKIVWSWHVWVTRFQPNQTHNQITRGTQTMMDRNLGAVSSVYGDNGVIGLQFQWGRKDPIPSLGEWQNLNAGSTQDAMRPLWDASGTPVTLAKRAATADAAENLIASIQNPLTFITNGSGSADWYTTKVSQGNDRWIGKGNSKTIYDPCPKGWRVPVSGEGSASPWLNMGTPPLWSHGPVWYDGTYLPAEGARTAGTASLRDHDFSVYYWSATPFVDPDNYVGQNGYAYCLEVSGLTFNVASHTKYARGNAMSMRCARMK
ncbi:MAG: fimbrillin family protein [Alistipes sp.]|jgi:hypothetical protein|nr:fimbrillin family protein [Alistipes sp.]